jgi:hypothetical protein
VWSTFTEENKVSATDPTTGVTSTGHATFWRNFNLNERNSNTTFTGRGGTPQAGERNVLAITLLGAALGVAGAVLSWVALMYQRATRGLGTAVGFGALGSWLATALAAWDRTDAVGPLGWRVALPIVGGMVRSSRCSRRWPLPPHRSHDAARPRGPSSGPIAGAGERLVWAHRMFVAWPLAIAAVPAVVAVAPRLHPDVVIAVLLGAGLGSRGSCLSSPRPGPSPMCRTSWPRDRHVRLG